MSNTLSKGVGTPAAQTNLANESALHPKSLSGNVILYDCPSPKLTYAIPEATSINIKTRPMIMARILQAAITLFTTVPPSIATTLNKIMRCEQDKKIPSIIMQDAQQLFNETPDIGSILSESLEKITMQSGLFTDDYSRMARYFDKVTMLWFIYMLKTSGFVPSHWNPTLDFELFRQTLQAEGPLIIMGIWSYPNHQPNATKHQNKLPKQYTARLIKTMDPRKYIGAKTKTPTFIVVVGAVIEGSSQYILYIDPIEILDITQTAAIYKMPYATFIAQICSLTCVPKGNHSATKFTWDTRNNLFAFFLPISKAESLEARDANLAEYYYGSNISLYYYREESNSAFDLINITNQEQQKIVLFERPNGHSNNSEKPEISRQSVMTKPFILPKILQAAIELFTQIPTNISDESQRLNDVMLDPRSYSMEKLRYACPNFCAFFDINNKHIQINTTRFSNDPTTSSFVMLLFIYMLKMSGFIPSSWHPKLEFNDFMREIEQQGPQIAFGIWGYPNHNPNPNATRQVNLPSLSGYPRPIKQMNKSAYTGNQRAIPTFIVIVGAIRNNKDNGFILYRDPMDACSQTNPAPIFRMPYERFISKICSFNTIPSNNAYFVDGNQKFDWDIKTDRFTFFLPLSQAESESAKKAGLAEYYLRTNTGKA